MWDLIDRLNVRGVVEGAAFGGRCLCGWQEHVANYLENGTLLLVVCQGGVERVMRTRMGRLT